MPQQQRWRVEAEFRVEVGPDDVERFQQGATAAFYNSADQVLRVVGTVVGDGYREAVAAAVAFVEQLPAQELVGEFGGSGPVRLVVETEQARAAHWAVGTAEAAELLGLSTARVRKKAGDPDFPASIAEPAGGKVFRRDEIEALRAASARATPNRGGRPPTGRVLLTVTHDGERGPGIGVAALQALGLPFATADRPDVRAWLDEQGYGRRDGAQLFVDVDGVPGPAGAAQLEVAVSRAVQDTVRLGLSKQAEGASA